MTTTVVVINGLPRTGKDTVVERTSHFLLARRVASASMSSIDPFRDAVQSLGFDPHDKTPEMRGLLADFKAATDRRFPDHSNKLILNTINALLTEDVSVFFIHIREPLKIASLKRMLEQELPNTKFLSILVKSDRAEQVTSNESDMFVNDYKYDLTINNNGTLQELDEGCFDLANYIVTFSNKKSAA